MNQEEFTIIAIPFLISIFFASFIPRKLSERQSIIKESAIFIEAFDAEIRFVDLTYNIDRAGKDIPEILRNAYDRHELAYIRFRKYLGWLEKKKIDKAWGKYIGQDSLLGEPTFTQYVNNGIINRAQGNNKIALSRLRAILSVAEIRH